MTRRLPSDAPASSMTNGSRTPLSLEYMSRLTREFAAVAADNSEPVMIYGETGTGKTYLARIIHQLSDRCQQSFIQVDCGAIPETLFERELFGHVRGAFTGADRSSAGLLESASRGTLFLDELGELRPHLQSTLLRALDEGTFRPIGSSREVTLDARIISATNRDIDALVRSGKFREDLLYRCRVLEFRLPPLRHRMDEFDRLVEYMLSNVLAWNRSPFVTDAAFRSLRSYHWPGNLRELNHALRHAIAYARDQPIAPAHLPAHVRHSPGRRRGDRSWDPGPYRSRYSAPESAEQEVAMILRALEQTNGNRSRAAKMLGMSRTTLWTKINMYGL